jgi:hypothetical protein
MCVLALTDRAFLELSFAEICLNFGAFSTASVFV